MKSFTEFKLNESSEPVRLTSKDSNGNVHHLSSWANGHVELRNNNSKLSLSNVMGNATHLNGDKEKETYLKNALKTAHPGGKDSVKAAAEKATGMKWDHKSVNEEESLQEVLTKADPIEKWIHDFVHSDDPRFAGKSKEERIKMAQGAYYGKQDEAVKQPNGTDKVNENTLSEEDHEYSVPHYAINNKNVALLKSVVAKHGAKHTGTSDKGTWFSVHKDKSDAFKRDLKSHGISADRLDEEQIDEISKATLKSYIPRAAADLSKQDKAGNLQKGTARLKGIIKATNKLAENISIDEATFMGVVKNKKTGMEFHAHAAEPAGKTGETTNKQIHLKDKSGKVVHKYLDRKDMERHYDWSRFPSMHESTESGFVVKYNTAKGEHKNTSKVFDTKQKAQDHADKGNSIDKSGGKYSVHALTEEQTFKSISVSFKEETLDEATSPMQKLRDAHDRHMQKALAANKAGDDEATKVHQVYMQKITAKMNKLKQNEEIDLAEMEELCEISKATLGSYVKKSHDQLVKHTGTVNMKYGRGDKDATAYALDKDALRKTANRNQGIDRALNKLTKEELLSFSQFVEGKIDDLKDKRAEKDEDDYLETKSKEESPIRKVKGSRYGSNEDEDESSK